MADLSFEDRFDLLVDHEWTTRKNNHLNRLIKISLRQIHPIAWTSHGTRNCEKQRHIPQDHRTVQKAVFADFGWVAAVSSERNRSKRSAWDCRSKIQESFHDFLLSVWHSGMEGQNRRSHSGWCNLWPNCSRFLSVGNRLQGIDAQAKRCVGTLIRRSLRLIGLCPNPRFNAWRFSGKSDICDKQKRRATHVRHGITLPAKSRIRRSGRSSALPYPPLRLKAFSAYHKTSLLSMYNFAVDGVQFVPTALFNKSRWRCSTENGQGVQPRRYIQRYRMCERIEHWRLSHERF